MAGQKVSLILDPDLLKQVEAEAERQDQVRTVWIQGAINQRLGHSSGVKNFNRAVSAAMQAGRGKLSRHEAMSVAAKVITALNQD